MADISIKQKHRLSHKNAKAAAQKVADQMAQEYDMSSAWDGDMLVFKRRGVSGTLSVHKTEAQLEIHLGFVLKIFSGKIEHEVSKNMKKVFGGKM